MSRFVDLPGAKLLGLGYDIRDKYADVESRRARIIDLGPFNEVKRVDYQDRNGDLKTREYSMPSGIEVLGSGVSSFESSYGNTITKYQEELSAGLTINGSYGCFNGSLDFQFGSKTFENSFNEFNTVRAINHLWTLTLKDNELNQYITDSAREDLDGSRMKPLEVLEKYGAYYLHSIVVGGKIEFSSSTAKVFHGTDLDVKASAEAAYGTLAGSVEAKVDTRVKKSSERLHEISTFKMKVVGGRKGLEIASAAVFLKDEEALREARESYRSWVDSVDEFPAFVAFDRESLKPIWDLCENTTRRKALYDSYSEYMAAGHLPITPKKMPLLEVKLGVSFIEAGANRDSDGKPVSKPVAVWKPVLSDGYFWVGQYAQGNYNQPGVGQHMPADLKKVKPIVVKPLVPGAVAEPIDYELIWSDTGSGLENDYSCWRPVPPPDYRALGDIMKLNRTNYNKPTGDDVKGLVCVHKSLCWLCKPSYLNHKIWDDKGIGGAKNVSLFACKVLYDTGLRNSEAFTFYGNRGHADRPTSQEGPYYRLKENRNIVSISNW